jgi:hypothetical protein
MQGNRIILDPNDPTQIYITTYGGGVWHGPAAGASISHLRPTKPAFRSLHHAKASSALKEFH